MLHGVAVRVLVRGQPWDFPRRCDHRAEDGPGYSSEVGSPDGLDMLHMLAGHFKTLDYVSRKLVSWLSGMEPPQAALIASSPSGRRRRRPARGGAGSALGSDSALCSATTQFKLKRPFPSARAMRQLGADTSDQFLATRI